MTNPELPAPATPSDLYLAAIHDVLGEILDRLPTQAPAQEMDGGTVELREPATTQSGGEASQPGPRPARKHAARKPAARAQGPKTTK